VIRKEAYGWRPGKGKRRDPRPLKESPVHIFAVQLLTFSAAPGVLYFHVPNEGRRAPRTGAFQKRLGLLPGVADLVIVLPGGQVRFLELKREVGGTLSENQRAFRTACEANGSPYEVATTPEEVEAVLRGWGALKTQRPIPVATRKAA